MTRADPSFPPKVEFSTFFNPSLIHLYEIRNCNSHKVSSKIYANLRADAMEIVSTFSNSSKMSKFQILKVVFIKFILILKILIYYLLL